MRGPRNLPALIALLEDRAARPHEWGRTANDCLSFVSLAALAQTGVDPARGLKWRDKASGLRLLAKLGGVEAVLDTRFDRIPVAHAHRGDIAGIPDPDLGLHPMLVEGSTLCAPGSRGLKRAPRAAAVAAWDVMSVRVPKTSQDRRSAHVRKRAP